MAELFTKKLHWWPTFLSQNDLGGHETSYLYKGHTAVPSTRAEDADGGCMVRMVFSSHSALITHSCRPPAPPTAMPRPTTGD